MKNIFSFFICFFTHLSIFGQNLDTLKNIVTKKQINFSRAQCKKDSIRATIDSQTKTIYYINILAPSGHDLLQKKELEEILKKDNIIFGGTWMGSDIMWDYTSESCYYYQMTRYAEEKYGNLFFTKKIDEALKNFLKNNPNRIFDYQNDEIDRKPLLNTSKSMKDFLSFLELEFFKRTKLLDDYVIKKSNELTSYLTAEFILDQKGDVSNIEIYSKFVNPYNQKFKSFFERQLKNYILSLKWKPNTYKGYIVKSKIPIYIPLP